MLEEPDLALGVALPLGLVLVEVRVDCPDVVIISVGV
jgi:hypothetical protein